MIVKSCVYYFSNDQFDQLIAPVVTFYSIKSRLHVGGDTTTTMDSTRKGCNDTVSTASETGLVFLEMWITKMVDNSVADNISNGADSGATTQENTYGILATDKNVFWTENTLDSDKPLGFTIPITLKVHMIPTTLEVYNIHYSKRYCTLEVTIPTTLGVYNIPTTLEVYNISRVIQYSRKYF